MEVGYGTNGKSCGHGSSDAGRDGNLAGILLVIGLLTRPAAFVAFLFLTSLWVSEWGTSWIWELLVPVLASLGIAVGRAGRALGHRRVAGRAARLVPVVMMRESACSVSRHSYP